MPTAEIKELRKQRDEARERRRDLERERQAIVDESTDSKLEKNRVATRQAQSEEYEADKRLNTIVKEATSQFDSRINEIVETIKQKQVHIRDLRNGVYVTNSTIAADGSEVPGGTTGGNTISERYIREDAVAFFRNQADQAQKDLDEMRRKQTHKIVRDFSTVVHKRDCEIIVEDRDKDVRRAAQGEKIWKLKDEIRQLSEERDELQEQRRKEILGE